MPQNEIRIIPIAGIPEVSSGENLARLITEAMLGSDLLAEAGDVFVIAQKVVSKAEGRVVKLDSVKPSSLALRWAADYDKDPRIVEVVLSESRRIVRMDRGILISETYHGFICANAGVDASNVESGTVTLLPEDPDRSAVQIEQELEKNLGFEVAVIVSDTFGRPWREGLVNVALGVAGVAAIIDLRGKTDWKGQPLRVTVVGVADELASAAELVMGKDSGVPVAIVRGFNYKERGEGEQGTGNRTGRDLIRAPNLDLFR
ncbi:MAG TPA: coenzyme F420-0:L-glutamate ligase [Blastocatellia bacterium]|nr:coenzyme F420-0:L-glutamate ligase [Blastocatellia bacterium]